MAAPSYLLNPRQQFVCSYGGFAGILLAFTCLIQLVVFGTSNWIVFVFLGIFALTILAFLLFALQKYIASIFLIVTAVLNLGVELACIRSGVFSLVILLLFLYNTIIVVFVYAEDLPKKLREKSRALKAEEALWEGKL